MLKNVNWEAINKINGYSLVWVKMRKEEIGNNRIEVSHQTRPFIVETKNDTDKIICGYYLTSNINSAIFNDKKGLRLVLNKDNYELKKNSLVLINKKIELPFENFISYFNPVNDIDLKRLKKYRSLISGIPVLSSKENSVVEPGDAVFYDNFIYIIFQVDNTQSYGYAINKIYYFVDIDKEPQYIKYNNDVYFVDYKNHRIFNKIEDLTIVYRFDNETAAKVIENKKILKSKNKIKKKNA